MEYISRQKANIYFNNQSLVYKNHQESKKDILENVDMSIEHCDICWEDYDDFDNIQKVKECNHQFHTECIKKWQLSGKNSCPNCRNYIIRDNELFNPQYQGIHQSLIN